MYQNCRNTFSSNQGPCGIRIEPESGVIEAYDMNVIPCLNTLTFKIDTYKIVQRDLYESSLIVLF